MTSRFELVGAIAGFGFSSGNRVVVGDWVESPIGPFCDVMWAEPDDHRTLITNSEGAAAFITAIYEFDSTLVEPNLVVDRRSDRLRVSWPAGELDLRVGRALPMPPRPSWFTEKIEKPIAQAMLGVVTSGVSPTGVKEVYRAERIRRITGGWGVVAGRDLGELGPPLPASNFGFSEPPPFPSVTEVRPLLEESSGRLASIVDRVRTIS